MGAVLATNSPQAASNVVADTAAASIPVINRNDPVENEYYKVLVDDDTAEKEVLGWMNDADGFAKAGGGGSTLTLNLKIQQRLDGIKREYEDFVELHPRHVNIRLAFGSFLNDNRDDEGAFTQWEAARQLAPTNPAAWNNLGNYYAHRGPFTNALAYYDKAIELNPSQAVYYHNLAAAVYLFRSAAREYYHLDEAQVFDKAQALYRQAIKLDPDNFILYTDFAQSFYGTDPPRWEDGLAAWTEALKLARDEVEREGVYLQMAHIQLELGQYDQARSDLNKAPAKAKTNAPTPADGGK
jgi:tetratricopeptide (TPR) repeat protein